MENNNYLGTGWQDEYGLNITINVEKFNKALQDGLITINNYGDVKIRVGKLKQQNERSKATHFVSVPKPKNDLPF